MRDILEDAQYYLNDNKYMDCHVVISAMANAIVQQRCEIERLKQDLYDIQFKAAVDAMCPPPIQ